MGRWLAAALLLLGVGAARAAPFQPDAVKTIALIEVIRFATGRYRTIEYADEAQLSDGLKTIAALDPKVQTLIWLALLENGLSEPTEADPFAPPTYIRMRAFDRQIETALAAAGMGARAAAFTAATAHPGTSGMVELGAAFGTKAAFGEAIAAYARTDPVAAAWCDQARKNLSDDDRLRALTNMLWRLDAPDWLRAWPEPYRVILLADMLDGEVGNGGVHQYFYNASGDTAPDAVGAMRALGLPRQAEAIEKGKGFFPEPYPTDQETRRKAFAHDGFTDWDERLNALTDIVDDGAVRPAMIAYAKSHDLLPR